MSDEHRTGLGGLLQPRGQVDRLALDRVLALGQAAGKDQAGGNAGAHGEARQATLMLQLGRHFAGEGLDGQGSVNGVVGVALAGAGIAGYPDQILDKSRNPVNNILQQILLTCLLIKICLYAMPS